MVSQGYAAKLAFDSVLPFDASSASMRPRSSDRGDPVFPSPYGARGHEGVCERYSRGR